ncbi:macro domain-containing protein [Lysinibacillus sp. NPDC093712]|uniref:macro domain-containing protein n=1 Tax=Lysinibacillus sp. NPDC093712 TaxID=3390579 RepID=UPI003D068B82
MINIVKGDILNTDKEIIGHQVNCLGVMGAGLAKQIKSKYSETFFEYKKICDEHTDNREDLMGHVYMAHNSNGKIIANIFSQLDVGRNERKTDYKKLKEGLKKVCKYAKENNLSVALPYRIGCGLAGGNWNIVYKIIDSVFEEYEVTLYEFS